MTVKLEFNNDFTYFLEKDKFNDSVQIVTESEIIKCSAVLLAQHSSVLREYIKEDNELFLTDNKHVRECLTILYGGSVSLTEENFQDILKFMVAFDIPGARKQILNWMSGNRWNLDNAGLLINGSMVASKTIEGKWTCSKEEIYKPCRLFFGQHLPKIIVPDSTDERYKNLENAINDVISGVVDKKELLTILLHQDLIPDYILWVNMLLDQSNYKLLLDSFEKPEISNAMSLCPRTQFEELFEKMEDFDNITVKEYKHLNRYKMKINDKITELQSLRFMKECGSLYSCWKILDADGMCVLSTAFTDKSDQFCVIECLLSWLAANKSSYDMDIVDKILSKAIHHLSEHPPENINVQAYCTTYVKNAMDKLQILPDKYNAISKIAKDRQSFNVNVTAVQPPSPYREEMLLTLSVRNQGAQFTVSVTLYQDRTPKVSCDSPHTTNYNLYVYAWIVEHSQTLEQRSTSTTHYSQMQPSRSCSRTSTFTRLPLYSDPDSAYKTLKLFKLLDNGYPISMSFTALPRSTL